MSTQKTLKHAKFKTCIYSTDFVRENVTDIQDSVDKLYTAMTAKTIRIGTHKFDPTEKVIISSKGIRIIAPNVKRPSENGILDIQKQEICKIVCHFPKTLPLLIIYTIGTCGLYIRESLEMCAIANEDSTYTTQIEWPGKLNRN